MFVTLCSFAAMIGLPPALVQPIRSQPTKLDLMMGTDGIAKQQDVRRSLLHPAEPDPPIAVIATSYRREDQPDPRVVQLLARTCPKLQGCEPDRREQSLVRTFGVDPLFREPVRVQRNWWQVVRPTDDAPRYEDAPIERRHNFDLGWVGGR